jgi:hypothetical protein
MHQRIPGFPDYLATSEGREALCLERTLASASRWCEENRERADLIRANWGWPPRAPKEK